MPAHSGYFPTSLDGSTPVQVTTSKPPTWKRMCDQAETNLRASGKTRPPSGDAVSSFENEVSCSLDRALEKLLSSWWSWALLSAFYPPTPFCMLQPCIALVTTTNGTFYGFQTQFLCVHAALHKLGQFLYKEWDLKPCERHCMLCNV